MKYVWVFCAHDSNEHVWACVCRGMLGWSGLNWLCCIINNTVQKNRDDSHSEKKNKTQFHLPQHPCCWRRLQHLHTYTPRFPPRLSGNLCFGEQAYIGAGIQGKWWRAAEQADMSLFGQECYDERGERGVCWMRRRRRRRREQERGLEKHLSPLSWAPFSLLLLLSWPAAAGGETRDREIKKKKKRYKMKGGWESQI